MSLVEFQQDQLQNPKDDVVQLQFDEERDGLVYEQDYLFEVIKDNLLNPREKILDKPGNRVLQAYLYSMSVVEDFEMNTVFWLMDQENYVCVKCGDEYEQELDDGCSSKDCDGRVVRNISKRVFNEEVYNSERWMNYEWEFKQILKKYGCDRYLMYNEHGCISDHDHKIKRKCKCGSVFCPECASKEVLDRKKSLMKYVADVNHAHYTFTSSPEIWKKLEWDNINEYYDCVKETIQEAYEEIYDLEVGLLTNLHTFSSLTLKWQPHFDVFVSLQGVDEDGNIKNATYKRIDPEKQLYPNPELLKTLRKKWKNKLDEHFGLGTDISKTQWIKRNEKKVCNQCHNDDRETLQFSGNYVKCEKCGYEGEYDKVVLNKKLFEVEGDEIKGGILGDALRYFKRLPIVDDNIVHLDEDVVIFTTDKRKKIGSSMLKKIEDDKTSEVNIVVSVEEFYMRLSQHIPPRNFRVFRPSGIYSYNHSKRGCLEGYPAVNKLDLEREEIREIARVVLDVVVDLVEGKIKDDDYDTDNENYGRFLYMANDVASILTKLGIIERNKETDHAVFVALQKVIDDICNSTIENSVDGIEYSVFELRNLFDIESSELPEELYDIKMKVFNKIVAAFLDEQFCPECESHVLYEKYVAYGDVVNRSTVAFSIFNQDDFKQLNYSLNKMLLSSNKKIKRYLMDLEEKTHDS